MNRDMSRDPNKAVGAQIVDIANQQMEMELIQAQDVQADGQ